MCVYVCLNKWFHVVYVDHSTNFTHLALDLGNLFWFCVASYHKSFLRLCLFETDAQWFGKGSSLI